MIGLLVRLVRCRKRDAEGIQQELMLFPVAAVSDTSNNGQAHEELPSRGSRKVYPCTDLSFADSQ